MPALGSGCNALAVTPLTVETEYLSDDEKAMYVAFIGNCTINGIMTGEDAVVPSVEINDDSMTVRFVPLANTSFDFDFHEGSLAWVSLTMSVDDEYVLSNVSTLYIVFVEACNPEIDTETAKEIVTYLFDHLSYDAECDGDFATYFTTSESYTLLHTPPDSILLIEPAR